MKEYEDLTFSINPQDVDECHDVSPREYATYDILTNKIWIWLFRINKMAIDCLASEDNVICNIIYNIEHEWIHRLDAECIGKKRYLNLNREAVELRVRLQQSRGSKINERSRDKNSEVKGTPADVMEALKRGIISKEEAERVLEQMRKRDKKILA